MSHILIVDDEADIRGLIADILEDEGYSTAQACDGKTAYEAVSEQTPDMIILDIWLEGSNEDGLEILKSLKAQHPFLPIIMISGHGTIETAVHALKDGAYDFIEKPFKTDRLLILAQRAIEAAHLKAENNKLRQMHNNTKLLCIGKSPVYQKFEQMLQRAAKVNSRVVLTGESGSGKTAAAFYIHEHSQRCDGPFVQVNCATLNPEQFEIDLFGAEKHVAGLGVAVSGYLEQANGGALLLDEVSDMPLATQAKLLRVLQSSSFERLGSDKKIDLDVRIIAASHKDLKDEAEAQRFREDLFYRLNVLPVDVPALRSFSSDLEVFIEYFSKIIVESNNFKSVHFSASAMRALKAYGWPGNIRELRNFIEWMMIVHQDGGDIDVNDLPDTMFKSDKAFDDVANDERFIESLLDCSLKEARAKFEYSYLQAQLDHFDGNISKTADNVGMERSALHRKIKQLKLLSSKGNV